MRRLYGLLLALALFVSGCTSGSSTDEKVTSSTTTSTSATRIVVQQTKTFEVFVNTRLPGECDEAAKAGDCWLPAYERPTTDARVLNLNDEDPSSPCRRVEVSGKSDSQLGCLPQPQATAEVVCDLEAGGKAWRAFVVRDEWRLIEPSRDAMFTADGKLLGWNLKIFLDLPKASNEAVPNCTY